MKTLELKVITKKQPKEKTNKHQVNRSWVRKTSGTQAAYSGTPKSNKITLWKCPTCGRHFERKGQSHSCKFFPLEQHFVGKEKGKAFYENLLQAVRKRIGPFKIESLQCCIHFVSTATFAAVKIFKDKIQLEFSVNHPIKSKRFDDFVQMSAHRYLYSINLHSKHEINKEVIDWVQEAYALKPWNTILV